MSRRSTRRPRKRRGGASALTAVMSLVTMLARLRGMSRRVVTAGLVLGAVALYAVLGPSIRNQVGLEGAAPPPASDETLRIVSWNLRNFPEPDEDLALLREHVDDLKPALLVAQEVRDPEALGELFPEHRVLASSRGGRGGQKLAFVFDPTRIEPTGPTVEHLELTLGGSVRPAFAAPFRVRGSPQGQTLDFVAIAVHLKAMPDGVELRRTQWDALARIVDSTRGAREGQVVGAGGEPDVVVLGDFNPVGGPRDEPGQLDAAGELDALAAALARAGLRAIPGDRPCTAYWDGARRDAWKEPSVLDLVWVAGFEEALPAGTRTRVGGFCARAQCAAIRSTESAPEPALERISDHCPVVLDVPLAVR